MQRRKLLGIGLTTLAAAPAVLTACASAGSNNVPNGPFAMKVEKHVSIPTRDGGHVVADIFRPDGSGKFPVIMTMGPYPKDIPFKAWSPPSYERQEMKSGTGDADYMHWETPLPDFWVPEGYVLVRCDQRGSGASPGKLDVFGPQTQQDFYDAIEWAAAQPWSNGKVGLLGDSYFASSQWLVAQLQPPHLVAMMPMSGFTDFYRDAIRQGGILSANFPDLWYVSSAADAQYGGKRSIAPTKLSPAELAANTAFPVDFRQMLRDHKLASSAFFTDRIPDLSKVKAAVYAHANNGGIGLHSRGTIEGFSKSTQAAFRHLVIDNGMDPDKMYSRADVAKQKAFFDRFLKGIDNGFDRRPRVEIEVRKGAGFVTRTGEDYPLPGTVAQKMFLDAASMSLGLVAPGTLAARTYRSQYGLATGAVRFATAPLPRDYEIIGPLRLHLALSCSGTDADVFVALREIRPDGTEVTAQGANDPAIPVAMGWLRASMRKADAARSTDFRVWHPYDEARPLTPNATVELDVNIWPTAWIIERGNTLVVEIGGTEQRGMVTFTHPAAGPWKPDGTNAIDNGQPAPSDVTLHTGGVAPSYLVVPTRSS
ncbi:MAG: peptidase [Ramlibacter sp.]|nr:peptidase [Ramlibacter sp.]